MPKRRRRDRVRRVLSDTLLFLAIPAAAPVILLYVGAMMIDSSERPTPPPVDPDELWA